MKKKFKDSLSGSNLIIWILCLFFIGMIGTSLVSQKKERTLLNNKKFSNLLKSQQILDVLIINERELVGKMIKSIGEGEERYKLYTNTQSESFLKELKDNKIIPDYTPKKTRSLFVEFLTGFLPGLLLIFILFRLFRGKNSSLTNFSKSPQVQDVNKISFNDVAGIDETKEDLQEIVGFLKDPSKFSNLGGKIPKGALLVGPPGTGKTLLAKAVAGEAGVPFFSISGSEFVELYVGVGASRVRNLFAEARKQAPCIIFIDEIDAIGKARGNGYGGGNDEREQTLNQMLVEMDGFGSEEGVIVIAATNRADVLDSALLRPGRFDRRIHVSLPTLSSRLEILEIHTKNKKLSQDINLKSIAQGTGGMSGADLQNLVNEASLLAARKNKDFICNKDFDKAKDKILMGGERTSMILSESEKKHTAYHESGHALMAFLLEGLDQVHKVSIIPRGRALGVTQLLPREDKFSTSKKAALNSIKMLLGGRLAEKLFFDHYTTGASNDIQRATMIATKMVREWGMSDEFGPMNLDERQNQLLGERTLTKINDEIKKILIECESQAQELILKHKETLEIMSESLIKKEIMDNNEIKEVLEKELNKDLFLELNFD